MRSEVLNESFMKKEKNMFLVKLPHTKGCFWIHQKLVYNQGDFSLLYFPKGMTVYCVLDNGKKFKVPAERIWQELKVLSHLKNRVYAR